MASRQRLKSPPAREEARLHSTLLAVCVSPRKGGIKQPVDHAEVRENFGIMGDAHAGSGHRQVSLLSVTDIDSMRARGLELEFGAFGENLVVAGLDFDSLGIGSILKIGKARLELTQIGKVCHTRCAIYAQSGDCIMPRAGLFARVTKEGQINPGLEVKVERWVSRRVIQAAVLTVSDRCSRGETMDTAGPAVSRLLEKRLEAHLAWSGIIPDERDDITVQLRDLAERGLDLIVTVGGTGCAPRDVTPEATSGLIQKEVPGLAEAMRCASAQITPHALTQRGICGIYRSTLIVNLPGSEKAAVENLQVILPSLPHALQHLRGEPVHLVEETRRRKASGTDG